MAGRTIRVASVQLGPISLEAGLLSAVADEEASVGLVSLCQHPDTVHKNEPASTIRRTDACPVCANHERSTFVKGKVVGDSVIVIDAAELQAVKDEDAAYTKKIELTVHRAADMAKAFPSGKAYYLAPRGPAAANNYALLAKLLAKRPDLAFVGEFSFGGAAALYQVIVDADVLILRQLARPDQVRERPAIEGEANEQFLTLAEQFADAICADYDPAAYRDKRTAALTKLLSEAAPVALSGTPGTAASPTVDLGAALQAALAQAAPAPAKPARRRATKKTAA